MTTGLFGKIPSYGDFLSRDLDTRFVDVWDAWLQGFVAGTQEQLGDSWLDVYLTSPIWRFAFSSGVVDENSWAGLVLPSVDRVGRYFPFSLVKKLDSAAPPVVMREAGVWYDELEEVALQALEGETSVDDILTLVGELEFEQDEIYGAYSAPESLVGAVVNLEQGRPYAQTAYPHLLHHTLMQSLQSYSLWSTKGSQYVEPCVFYCKSLPQVSNAASLLDGNWQASSWAQPFPLVTEPLPKDTEVEDAEKMGIHD